MLLSHHPMVQQKMIKTWCTENPAQFPVTHIASSHHHSLNSVHHIILTLSSMYCQHSFPSIQQTYKSFLFFLRSIIPTTFKRDQSTPHTRHTVMQLLLPQLQSPVSVLGGYASTQEETGARCQVLLTPSLMEPVATMVPLHPKDTTADLSNRLFYLYYQLCLQMLLELRGLNFTSIFSPTKYCNMPNVTQESN